MKKLLGLGIGLLALVPALWATQAPRIWGPQEPPYRPERPIVIQGGTLIDATGAPPKLDHAVVIEGEEITWVGPMKDASIPDGAEIIDASGMTIMPGLINSNQHTQLNPLYHSPRGNLPLEKLRAQWEESWSRIPRRSFVYLMQGVTSMRNTSGPAKRLIPVKNAIDNGEIPGPRIFLGGALLWSRENFEEYIEREESPPDTAEWLRNEFAFVVVDDPDKDTDRLLGSDFNYWKFVMSGSKYDGKNDFSDKDVRFIIDKARKNGKFVDVHCGGHNSGLRRMLAFDFDTLEHPFYGGELIEEDIIEGYVEKGVVVDTLLEQMIARANRAADPNCFDETLYIMSMEPKDYRILMRYRDKMVYNQRHPDDPELVIHGEGRLDMSYKERQKRREISRENMRRFIRAGAKFSLGTDTTAFMNLQQEDPNANEMRYMVEMGMSPMQVIQASTRNGAEILGLQDKLGTIEAGKWADVIVVAGNPLDDMKAMKRVAVVIKGGVRYK